MRDIGTTNKPDKTLKVFNLLMEMAHAVLKDADRHLHKAAGLSSGKFVVLVVLSASGGIMTAAKLAERTGTRPHNITVLIERMKLDGLVATERNDVDRRFVHIRLSAKGRSVLAHAMPAAREVVARVMTSISEPDLTVLERLLTVLKQNTCRDSSK